jgi:AcrR family transcriptional regulator
MNLRTKVRPVAEARREAILDVAAEIFLEQGFAAASMSTIAARLGGSKGTLYNYFPNKEALFEACVRRHCAVQQRAMFALLTEGTDVRKTLADYGRGFLTFALSDISLGNFRIVAAEAERSPAIGCAFYEAGPLGGVTRLAAFLEKAAREGAVDVRDPLGAAHQFVALCQNRMLKARLCGVMAAPSAQAVDEEVAAAVETFLAAFGPKESAGAVDWSATEPPLCRQEADGKA